MRLALTLGGPPKTACMLMESSSQRYSIQSTNVVWRFMTLFIVTLERVWLWRYLSKHSVSLDTLDIYDWFRSYLKFCVASSSSRIFGVHLASRVYFNGTLLKYAARPRALFHSGPWLQIQKFYTSWTFLCIPWQGSTSFSVAYLDVYSGKIFSFYLTRTALIPYHQYDCNWMAFDIWIYLWHIPARCSKHAQINIKVRSVNQFTLLWDWYYGISPEVKIQSFLVFSPWHLGASLLQIVADLRSCCPPYPLSRPRSSHDLQHVHLDRVIAWIHVLEANPCRLSCETFWVEWTGLGWIMGRAEGAFVKVG